MKLKYNFAVMNMGDEIAAVPIGANAPAFNGMIRLNKSGAEILELLREETTVESVTEILLSRYPDSSREEICSMLESFLSVLRQEDALKLP